MSTFGKHIDFPEFSRETKQTKLRVKIPVEESTQLYLKDSIFKTNVTISDTTKSKSLRSQDTEKRERLRELISEKTREGRETTMPI